MGSVLAPCLFALRHSKPALSHPLLFITHPAGGDPRTTTNGLRFLQLFCLFCSCSFQLLLQLPQQLPPSLLLPVSSSSSSGPAEAHGADNNPVKTGGFSRKRLVVIENFGWPHHHRGLLQSHGLRPLILNQSLVPHLQTSGGPAPRLRASGGPAPRPRAERNLSPTARLRASRPTASRQAFAQQTTCNVLRGCGRANGATQAKLSRHWCICHFACVRQSHQ